MVSSNVYDDDYNMIYHGNHAWNVIKIGGEWFHVDACWDDPEHAANAVWFLKDDARMRQETGNHAMWRLIPRYSYSSMPASAYNLTTAPVCNAKIGDVNNSGAVNQTDATRLQRYLAHYTTNSVPAAYLHRADMNFDGAVDLKDLVKLAQIING